MFVIFDLDGTLAMTRHRDHHLAKEPRDWDAFNAACGDDLPNTALIETFNALSAAGHRVAIWTGRPSTVAFQTINWLIRHGVGATGQGGYGEIVMRAEGDYRTDVDLKAAWLDEEAQTPDLVFEDRTRMVAWWRERGIVCAQVAPGLF